jgi:phage terminase large subunit-like protein
MGDLKFYKEPTADQLIWWIESTLFVPEGKLLARPMRLGEWQKRNLRLIYDNEEKTRTAILSFGRKNGKTSFAACLLLMHLCGPKARPNSSMFSAAQSREQAAIIFGLAAKMARMSPVLRDQVRIKQTTKELFCPHFGTRYRALSSEANTAYGLSPVFAIHDELGQNRGPRSALFEAIETATGAQENPLSIVISTQAPTNSDLLSVLIDDALAGNDPRTICSLYTAPMDADPFAYETLKMANPALGDFLNPKEVMSMAEQARRMPAREPEFRNLILNQRVEALSPFISVGMWQSCNAPPEKITGVQVYGGLDLSEIRDLTALVLVGNVNGVWQVHPTFWLPDEGLREKSDQDRVPYFMWRDKGFLETCPGKSVSYEYVADYLRKVFSKYQIEKIGFDKWNMKHLRPWLLRAGFTEAMIDSTFVEFGQGTQSMSPALRDLEGAILDKKLAHGDHPVLSMCMCNAVVESKDASNRKLSKNRSSGRIDGAVALAMAFGVIVAPATHKFDIRAMIA